MSKIRRNWFPLALALCMLACIVCIGYVFAQVSPQIQGAGAPSNPCNNGGQQYVDQTNHVLYSCPSSGSNWVNLGLGQGTSSGFTNNGTQLTASLPVVFPVGTAAAPSGGFAGDLTTGFFHAGAGDFDISISGNDHHEFTASALITEGIFLDFANADVRLTRAAAGVLQVGTGGSNSNGYVKSAAYVSGGSTFAASGCANSTLVGGATAGTYKSVTGGSCTVTITMGNSATAPNGWACDAHDLTTVADANNVTMGTSNTTTANLVEGTVAANDIIAFKCVGY